MSVSYDNYENMLRIIISHSFLDYELHQANKLLKLQMLTNETESVTYNAEARCIIKQTAQNAVNILVQDVLITIARIILK
jgi:hypothetical protein